MITWSIRPISIFQTPSNVSPFPPTPPLKLRRRGLLKIDVLAGRLFSVCVVIHCSSLIINYYLVMPDVSLALALFSVHYSLLIVLWPSGCFPRFPCFPCGEVENMESAESGCRCLLLIIIYSFPLGAGFWPLWRWWWSSL